MITLVQGVCSEGFTNLVTGFGQISCVVVPSLFPQFLASRDLVREEIPHYLPKDLDMS